METLNLSSSIFRFLSSIPHIEIKDSLFLNVILLLNVLTILKSF
ncbi:hypothetical protein [Brachyspira pulli]